MISSVQGPDLLFNALLGFAFMFAVAFMLINSSKEKGNIESKAEVLITIRWEDDHPDDVDAVVEDPRGGIVWYHNRDTGLMHLDRDDRGNLADKLLISGDVISNPINQETVTIRKLVNGEYIINLQGDMPNIDPSAIKILSNYMSKNLCDIATLGSKFKDNKEIENINNVKVATKNALSGDKFENAIDFFRDNENIKERHVYHHIGIYAFTKEALLRYVSLDRTKKELDRNLEQLRALENNMKIHIGYTPSSPLSIDTEEDLRNVQELMKNEKK